MALLNRFSKLNDRGETGIFTFIVTKSVTRDFHRDATTKDFCFGYHRWAISFQRPNEKVLGVHLLLRNPSPSTSCLVDFTLTLLNREHFSQNEVYTKRQAKFTITNPMQGVARWIQMSDLTDKHFSNETGEFLFELSLSNMTTIFECDIQLGASTLTQYKSMLKLGSHPPSQQLSNTISSGASQQQQLNNSTAPETLKSDSAARHSGSQTGRKNSELINLETNYFTFGAFDWSLTIVPLVIPSSQPPPHHETASGSSSLLLTPNKQLSSSSHSIASNGCNQPPTMKSGEPEPVCRVYLNRLNGFDCLCRVKYRVILGHHQPGSPHPAEFVDSRLLDQISDSGGRIRGHQFRNTNILKLISLRSGPAGSGAGPPAGPPTSNIYGGGKQAAAASSNHHSQQQQHLAASLDLRVHIEMFCANTVSEVKVPAQRKPNEAQVSNCSDRNKQAWCVELDSENENVRLKLFFMDLQSVPRNHIRYISWIAYIVRRDSKSGAVKESIAVRNSPHSNYYLQDGIDMGTLMDTDIATKELNNSPKAYLDGNQLTVHIEWVDSLLLFSHLYNNYDSLATIQRHQISRELCALQQEYELLERKHLQNRRALNQLLDAQPGNCQSQATGTPPDGHTNDACGGASHANHRERRHSTLRKGSLAAATSSETHPASWAFHGAAPDGSGAAAAMGQQMIMSGHHQQHHNQHKTPPMSQDERLKFSSSTPPAGRQQQHHHPQPPHQLRQRHSGPSLAEASPAHQQLLEQLKLSGAGGQAAQIAQAAATGSQAASRRRLPQQPILSKIQAQEMRHIISQPDLLLAASYQQQHEPASIRQLEAARQLLDSSSSPSMIFGSPVKALNSASQQLDNTACQAMVAARTPEAELLTHPLAAAHHAPMAQLEPAAAAAAACSTVAHSLANQAEQQADQAEAADRYLCRGSIDSTTTTYPPISGRIHHHRPSGSAAASGGAGHSPFAVYERTVMMGPTGSVASSEHVMLASAATSGLGNGISPNAADSLDLEMEMEALYVAAGGTKW